MENALTSVQGRMAGQYKTDGKKAAVRFRNAVHSLKRLLRDIPEETAPDEDMYVNVCGCAVSVYSLPDCPLMV